jgi:hypothetical protein
MIMPETSERVEIPKKARLSIDLDFAVAPPTLAPHQGE